MLAERCVFSELVISCQRMAAHTRHLAGACDTATYEPSAIILGIIHINIKLRDEDADRLSPALYWVLPGPAQP